MYFCDVGNTNATLYKDGKIWSIRAFELGTFKARERVFYINVNSSMEEILKDKRNFVDLGPHFDFDTDYKGMGIDRICACYSIQDGVIIDAGTAITIDLMSGGRHAGGFILPGISALLDTFAKISPSLNVDLKTNMDLDALPMDTRSAVSYGVIKPILLSINDICKDEKIFFTGGDGAFLSRFFPKSIYKRGLVFDGMKQLVKEIISS
ncbi:MAG: pantothenate kinase [Proteobacteria bacterium]|nr:MAG: pantothenate kinase [Pseudomonadota bacterium]